MKITAVYCSFGGGGSGGMCVLEEILEEEQEITNLALWWKLSAVHTKTMKNLKVVLFV